VRDCETLIIGAGIAGLTAARSLGESCLVVDKSRGVGGRMATRRVDSQPVDHGMPFLAARTPEFQNKIAHWKALNLCHQWISSIADFDNGKYEIRKLASPLECVPGGMTAIAKYEAEGVEIEKSVPITNLRELQGNYIAETSEGPLVQAKQVIITTPAPQALRICAELVDEPTVAQLSSIEYLPTLTAIIECPDFSPDWSLADVSNAQLGRVVYDSTKRNDPGKSIFVLHGSDSFNRLELEAPPEQWSASLLDSARKEIDPAFGNSSILHTHRWRFARVSKPLANMSFLPLHDRMVFAGDSFAHGDLESAWLSGAQAASWIQGMNSK